MNEDLAPLDRLGCAADSFRSTRRLEGRGQLYAKRVSLPRRDAPSPAPLNSHLCRPWRPSPSIAIGAISIACAHQDRLL